jgi:hypothetical protein
VVAVTSDGRAGTRNRGFDPVLELLGGRRHGLKGSGTPWLYFLKHDHFDRQGR